MFGELNKNSVEDLKKLYHFVSNFALSSADFKVWADWLEAIAKALHEADGKPPLVKDSINDKTK